MTKYSGTTISTNTLIGIIVGVFALLLVGVITAVLHTHITHKGPASRTKSGAIMGTIASKIGWLSKSQDHASNCSTNSPASGRAPELDSNSHSDYHLPDIPRFTTPSEISQAVFQAFRSSQAAPPQRAEQCRVKQNVIVSQRPRWSRWFGRQASEESSFSIQSSFFARESPLANVEPIDHELHGHFSHSSPPDPLLQHSNVDVYTSNLISASRPTTPSEIHMHGSGNPRLLGYDSGVTFSSTNGTPEYPQVVRPSSTYAVAFPSMSLLSPTNSSNENCEEVISPGTRARIVSNSSSWQHRSMHAEISDLPSENQSSDHPNGTVNSKFRATRQLSIKPIVEQVC